MESIEFNKKTLCILTFTFLFQVSVFSFEGTLKNFKIPLFSKEMENNGYIKGKTANFVEEGTFEIIKADAMIYIDETARTWQFKAEKCFLKKDSNLLWTEKYVQIRSDDIYIDGKGLEWNLNVGPLVIKKNVTMDINKKYFGKKKKTHE